MSSDVRRIGLFPATMLVAGNMIGAGIFMMPAIMASIGGVATLGWFVTVPGAFIIGYLFARLGRARPKAGGPYAYAREALGDFAGFQCNLLWWFSNVIGNIAIATSITGYVTVFFPALRSPYLGACCTILLIWLSAFLNMIGPRLVTRFETCTTLLGVGPIALVGIVGWFYFDPQVFASGWNPGQLNEFDAISSAVSIMFWAFMGVESASVAAAVVENPERNIARATLFGVLIAAVVYVLSTTAIMGIIPNDALRHSTAPFADAAMQALGPVGGIVITICAIVKASGCLGGWTLINAETALATARDGLFSGLLLAGRFPRRAGARHGGRLRADDGHRLRHFVDIGRRCLHGADGYFGSAGADALYFIFAAVSTGEYVQRKILSRGILWLALLTVIYCLGVIIASAGTAVAISMALGLATAPLFRAFLAFTKVHGQEPTALP